MKNIEAERYLLGIVLNDRAARVYAMSKVRPNYFSDEGYRAIYEAAMYLEEKDGESDLPVLIERLKKQGNFELAGGVEGVCDVGNTFFSAANVDTYIDCVVRAHSQRKLIKALRTSLSSLEAAPAESIDELETHIAVIEETFRQDAPENNELVDYHDCETDTKEQRGLLTGYADLDKHIDIRPGMVVTVYGDSGHKKTTFTMNMVAHWAKTEKIAVYNYEQHQREIAKMVREADFFNAIPRGNLWISPCPPPIEILPLQCKAIKARKGLSGVVVDYLQTVTTTNPKLAEDENNFVRCAMRTLRDLARNNGLWVLVVAQMRKASGDTTEHQLNPAIDRMRGSGEIKMASSIILSTTLPFKLEMDTWDDESTERMMLVRIKKNRDCLTGNPGEERVIKLVHQLDSRLITSWKQEAGLPSSRLPLTH